MTQYITDETDLLAETRMLVCVCLTCEAWLAKSKTASKEVDMQRTLCQ